MSVYRGKYPLKIKSVASAGKKFNVELNNGDIFQIDGASEMPRPGYAMSAEVLAAYAKKQHATRAKKNPAPRGTPFMKLPKLKPGYVWVDVAPVGAGYAEWEMVPDMHAANEWQKGKIFGYDEQEFLARQYKPKKNPVAKKLTARPKPAGKLDRKVFTVQHSDSQNGPWTTDGFFPLESMAREYARALDGKFNRQKYIRVTV